MYASFFQDHLNYSSHYFHCPVIFWKTAITDIENDIGYQNANNDSYNEAKYSAQLNLLAKQICRNTASSRNQQKNTVFLEIYTNLSVLEIMVIYYCCAIEIIDCDKGNDR